MYMCQAYQLQIQLIALNLSIKTDLHCNDQFQSKSISSFPRKVVKHPTRLLMISLLSLSLLSDANAAGDGGCGNIVISETEDEDDDDYDYCATPVT